MKSFKRLILGFLSSALFAVGLVRAADSMDPMSHSQSADFSNVQTMAPDTNDICNADLS